jgi:predicted signal transduction protein with EAL and GGDEF domain
LDVPITAEGIESDEMRAYLDNIGCTDGQGWLYGHPTSKEDLMKLLPQITLPAREAEDDRSEKSTKPVPSQNSLEKLERKAG